MLLRISKGEWEKADFGYLERGRYASQIAHVLRVFPREQVLFVVFEKFIQNQTVEFRRIQKWLGLTLTDAGMVKENIASSPRSEVLATLLHHHRYRSLRKVIGKLVGGKSVRNWLSSINQIEHTSGSAPKLSNEIRKTLRNQFLTDIKDVERLTGLDLSIWTE